MAGDVFISYSTKDAQIASRVCSYLEAHGIPCWIAPRNILGGHSFAAAIETAIRDCKAVVLVFSSAANQSKDIVRELKLANDANKTVVPLRIGHVKATGDLAYFIGVTQWVEAPDGPGPEHFQCLAAALGAGLHDAPSSSASSRHAPLYALAGIALALAMVVMWRLVPHPERPSQPPSVVLTPSPSPSPVPTPKPPDARSNILAESSELRARLENLARRAQDVQAFYAKKREALAKQELSLRKEISLNLIAMNADLSAALRALNRGDLGMARTGLVRAQGEIQTLEREQ